jgi:hypothetical protein
MTSTPNAKAATAARVAGFLALLAAGAALLVLFAAAAHALGSSSPKPEHAVGMHRPGAAPHSRHQYSGLRKDGTRGGRPDHHSRAHRAADGRSGQTRPAHGNSRTELATARSNHKTAGAVRVQGARHTDVQGNPERVWQL